MLRRRLPLPSRCGRRDCAWAQGCYQRSRGPHPRSLLAPRLTSFALRGLRAVISARGDPTPARCSLRDSLRSRCARAQGCYQRSRGPHPRSLLAPRLTSFALRSGSGLLSALAGTPPPLAARSATHFVRAALGLRAVISARGDPTPARCSLRDSLRSRCARAQGCYQRSRGPHPRSLLAPRLTSFALRSGSGLLSLRSRCARAQGCYQRSHPRSLLAPRLTSFALRSGSGLLSALAGTPPPLAARSATHFVRAALGLRAVISAKTSLRSLMNRPNGRGPRVRPR